MNRRSRIAGLLFLLLLVGAGKLGAHLYQWYAFAEERAALALLSEQLMDAGVEIVQLQLRGDTLRLGIESQDQHLDVERREIEAYVQIAQEGTLPAHLYSAYRQSLDAYNERIQVRNRIVLESKEMIARQNEAVQRFNTLADSIRTVAQGIGEPYYPIPLPVEAAIKRGLLPPVD